MGTSQRLTVSLGAIAENYRICQQHCQGTVSAVVKANGYGLGAIPIARHLAQQGCRHFFVACFSEAAALRQALPDHQLSVYVLEGLLDEPQVYLDLHITPVLNTLEQTHRWQATGQPWVVHVDTGMQRLGLQPQQLVQALGELKPSINLLMTHLACADEPDRPANQAQLRAFDDLRSRVEAQLGESVLISIGNTAGLMAVTHADQLSRAGIGLYGGNPFTEADNPFHPVAQLQGQVLQVRQLEPGAPVGYGGTYVADSRRLLATVGLGYADGVPRLLGNLGRVWCNGGYAPIVGRVSMDLLSVDITDLPEVSPGDWVEVFGPHVSVDEVAEHAQTISYEVLTGMGQRVERHYQQALLA